jgi:hypothetical protein
MSRPARVSQPKETAEPYLGAIAAASNEIRGNQEIRSSAPASRGAWWPVPARPCRLITIGWVGALTVEVASTSGVNASLRVLFVGEREPLTEQTLTAVRPTPLRAAS